MYRKFIALIVLLMSTQAQAFLVSDFSGDKVEVLDTVGDGRWLVVMLWQLDCIPCEQQKPAVEAFHNKYKSSKAHVIGLARDGHEYMNEIKQFVEKKPMAFPSYVVFGDVFSDQIQDETGKPFHTAPGYLVYAPDGELKMAIDRIINIDELVLYIEDQFVN